MTGSEIPLTLAVVLEGAVAEKLANMQHGGDRRSNQAANLPLVSQPEAARMPELLH